MQKYVLRSNMREKKKKNKIYLYIWDKNKKKKEIFIKHTKILFLRIISK